MSPIEQQSRNMRRSRVTPLMPGINYPSHVYWGDQHVHTAWSADAGMSGATLTPRDALRFARGEEVISSPQGPYRRQSGPYPNHQGVARCRRQDAREDLRCRLGRCGQAEAGCRREVAASGQHSRSRRRELDQYHRQPRANYRLEGPRLRSVPKVRSIMRECWRSPLRAGPLTMPSALT